MLSLTFFFGWPTSSFIEAHLFSVFRRLRRNRWTVMRVGSCKLSTCCFILFFRSGRTNHFQSLVHHPPFFKTHPTHHFSLLPSTGTLIQELTPSRPINRTADTSPQDSSHLYLPPPSVCHLRREGFLSDLTGVSKPSHEIN